MLFILLPVYISLSTDAIHPPPCLYLTQGRCYSSSSLPISRSAQMLFIAVFDSFHGWPLYLLIHQLQSSKGHQELVSSNAAPHRQAYFCFWGRIDVSSPPWPGFVPRLLWLEALHSTTELCRYTCIRIIDTDGQINSIGICYRYCMQSWMHDFQRIVSPSGEICAWPGEKVALCDES